LAEESSGISFGSGMEANAYVSVKMLMPTSNAPTGTSHPKRSKNRSGLERGRGRRWLRVPGRRERERPCLPIESV
jgi:hypothetical protein